MVQEMRGRDGQHKRRLPPPQQMRFRYVSRNWYYTASFRRRHRRHSTMIIVHDSFWGQRICWF
jgi:hypothetical protein